MNKENILTDRASIIGWNRRIVWIRNMCQNAFFPCLQGIKMRRSKRKEQKTDVWPDKKKIQSTVQKNKDAIVYRVQKKRKQDTQQFQIHGSEKN